MAAPVQSAPGSLQITFVFVRLCGYRARPDRQRKRLGPVALRHHDLAGAHLVKNPTFVLFARLQSQHRVGRAIEKDAETLFDSGDGIDKRKLWTLGFRRFCRWRYIGCSGNRGGRREGEKIGRSRVADSSFSGIDQSGLPVAFVAAL